MSESDMDLQSTDFVIGVDSFGDLEIADSGRADFFYFRNATKTLVKRFVLKRTALTQKNCCVTLIKKSEKVFEPRFEFDILDLSKRALATVATPIHAGEERLIKARVDLGDCHDAFSQLVRFIAGFQSIELSGSSFAVVAASDKASLAQALRDAGKDAAVAEFSELYGGKVSEKDLMIIAGRKKSLETFRRFLSEPDWFAKCKDKLGTNKRNEDVWQTFFERNAWVFGYGLQLVCCEGLDDRKLEAIVVGSDVLGGAGKRTDALLKTRGRVSKSLFCEIKTHQTRLMKNYPRPGVFIPSDDLQGAVAQTQKTVHKVGLRMSENFKRITDVEGVPSGESVAFVRPKGLVVVGMLSEFETSGGLLNEELFASFELFRQQLNGIEILTFDELYERTRFIVEG